MRPSRVAGPARVLAALVVLSGLAASGAAAAGVTPGLAAPAVATDEGASVARLGWLAGCWQGTRADRVVEEQWMQPRGGMMLGMSRTVRDGRTAEFEHMRIHEHEGRLVYSALPSGQEGASFTSIGHAGARVVFENKAHDFPQRILYRLQDDGSLMARIEGERDGKVRGVDYPMRRVACPGPEAR